ncbi:MAG: hypothetical protein SPLM_05090 [Spiroplasma phoeniceum]
MLLNQKQYAEIKLINKQVLKYKDTKGNLEEFIKHQKEPNEMFFAGNA